MDKEYIQERNNQNKKENKKYIPIFIVLMAICMVAGFFTGRAIKRFEIRASMEDIKNAIYTILIHTLPVVYVILILVLITVCTPILARLIKKAKAWDGENEDYIGNIEKGFSSLVNCSTIATTLSFGLFAINGLLLERDIVSLGTKKIIAIVIMVCLLVDLIFTLFIQAKALKYIKLINPEKKGNLFSFDFYKKWTDSCDEAQKYIMYKASFKAHKAINITCMILWLVTYIVGLSFHTGIMPVICVSIIWLVDIIVYVMEENKLEK